MAVTYVTAVKTSRMTAVRDAIDAGATGGKLEIGTSALSGSTGVLATFVFSTVCGTVSNGVLTFTFGAGSTATETATASATGAALLAQIRDANNVLVISGLTVGTTATDIILDSTAITSGNSITINAASITHAA